MAARPPLTLGSDGLPQRLPFGDKPTGFWAKSVTTTATGTLSVTIPAGVFAAAPIVTGQPIVPGTARDHVFTLTGVTYNANGTVTVAGFVRRSQVLLALGDPFTALPTQIAVHLIAVESD